MKIKVIVLGTLMCCSFLFLQAQNEQKSNINYANITEWGFLGSPSERYFSFEGTTVNGIAIRGHVMGLGLGIGIGGGEQSSSFVYIPLYLNYRYYFNYDQKFTPHVNVAFGGVSRYESLGIYSSLTTGFRAAKFSFSSGVFLQAYEVEQYRYDDFGNYTGGTYKEVIVPCGIILKLGFAF